MKRTTALICAAVMTASVLTACGNKATPAPSETINSPTEIVSFDPASSDNGNQPATDSAEIEGKGTVTDGIKAEGIPFFNDYSKRVYLLITNNSDKDCDLDINMDFYKGDKLVGTTSSSIDAVAKGTTVCKEFYCDEDFNIYDYKIVSSDLSYTVPVDQNLVPEISKLTNKVIVSLTNNGKIPAQYVWYDVFFYKEGQLVDHNFNYCQDKDSEIKPGQTEKSECGCYVDGGFDDVKLFFHGEGIKE